MGDEKLYDEVDDSDDHGPKDGETVQTGDDGTLHDEVDDGDHSVDPKSVVTDGEVDTSVDGEE